MSLAEVFPMPHGLPLVDATLPVWTPHHAFDAASALLEALRAEENGLLKPK